jgi:hypothetical protein
MHSLSLVALCFLVSMSAALECRDTTFWLEENKGATLDLQQPQSLTNDFNNFQYASIQPSQLVSAVDTATCTEGITFTLVGSPSHFTTSPPGYTPIVGNFNLAADGKFYYINIPSKDNAIVWNGEDSFRYTARCGSGPDSGVCKAKINIVFTKAATQNTPASSFVNGYGQSNYGVKCDSAETCISSTDGLWMTRHTLPRLWDMQKDENGQAVKPTIDFGTATNIDTDNLDFEWMSNYALISTYGALSNMGARFPTFEVVEWKTGETFSSISGVATTSTGFDQSCLNNQGTTGLGSDVWPVLTSASVSYISGTSWYHKFGGKHAACNTFADRATACKYAPLLTPRPNVNENDQGVWRLEIKKCSLKWQGKFTWNAMRNQKLYAPTSAPQNAFLISGGSSGADFSIQTVIYNEAVQPNSWTSPARGYVEIDKKYILTVALSSDTEFQFELGIDIFTVDLQQFRYTNGNSEQAFGFNMITYPTALNTEQSSPDRRVVNYKWVEHYWVSPDATMCPTCGPVGTETNKCVDSSSTYSGAFPDGGNCGSTVSETSGARVFLFKGPSTGSNDCSSVTSPMIVRNRDGLSPQEGCQTNFQNITIRGRAIGSQASTTPMGFEGKITLSFELANGEHPHFVIEPKMYVKSISIDGAFAGTSSTCRTSPYWPVQSTTQLPSTLCEEVDARTFGPTDWAVIFFDIKDVDVDQTEVTSLHIVINSVRIDFIPTPTAGYGYLNYRPVPTADLTNPSGNGSPKKTDFAFAFTPGAHNENTKITIYCTLRIKSTAKTHRRFASQEATQAENTVQERISITRRDSANALSSSNTLVESNTQSNNGANAASNSNASNVTVIVLAAACAVLLAAVIGMVLYVVRQNTNNAPKRVSSTA